MVRNIERVILGIVNALARGEKTGNGSETGHQRSGSWPDVTWLAPEMGGETVPCASWHFTSKLPPTHRQCNCLCIQI